MSQSKREIIKRLRFNAEQASQLELYLDDNEIGFTQLIHTLLKHELNASWPHVIKQSEPYWVNPCVIQAMQSKQKRKKSNITVRPILPVDPKLLFELGRIGNNLNQVARSLNILCLQRTELMQRFSYIDCIDVLESIQSELHLYLPSLPTYIVTEEQSERRKLQARTLAQQNGR